MQASTVCGLEKGCEVDQANYQVENGHATIADLEFHERRRSYCLVALKTIALPFKRFKSKQGYLQLENRFPGGLLH